MALLVLTALAITRVRSLLATVMLAGIYSFIGAGWMLVLDAPDVAFTEAAVGAGISTVLMIAALSLTTREEKRQPGRQIVPQLVVLITGGFLVYATLDMPYFGDPRGPAHLHVAPQYLEENVPTAGGETLHLHIPNVVTVVLASYRGYDTLGETTVIFTAAVAVLLLLGRRRGREENR